MKKITIYIVLALLCLNFKVKAQENKAVDVTLKGIQVGQKVPDITITNLHNYKNANGKPATTAKLSDFTGKLLILDFWATWCSPCVAMIPKMDSLQRLFGDKVQFLSVSYQKADEIFSFMDRLEKLGLDKSETPMVTNDLQLKKLFPHVYLPHYVWIDGAGTVGAVTDHFEVTEANITSFLKTGGLKIKIKRDVMVKFDRSLPLFENGNPGEKTPVGYSSHFSGYIPGIAGGYQYTAPDILSGRRITAWNESVTSLFALAVSKGKLSTSNRIELLVKDRYPLVVPTDKEAFDQWKHKNSYCLEIKLSPAFASRSFELMYLQLKTLFPQYDAKIEKRNSRCLVLVRTDTIDRLSAKSEVAKKEFGILNASLRNIKISQLVRYLDVVAFGSSGFPFIDGTGYTGNVDMDITANLSDVKALNKELIRYGLKVVEQQRLVEKVVITDVNPSP